MWRSRRTPKAWPRICIRRSGRFLVCVIVTVVVSLATKPVPDSELTGLVYGLTEVPSVGDVPLYQKPLFWAAVVAVVFFVLNIIFW